jgi:hypothetical protein
MDIEYGLFCEIHTLLSYPLHLFLSFLPYNYKCSLLMGRHGGFEVVEVRLHQSSM